VPDASRVLALRSTCLLLLTDLVLALADAILGELPSASPPEWQLFFEYMAHTGAAFGAPQALVRALRAAQRLVSV
jgi:hypothetical protein